MGTGRNTSATFCLSTNALYIELRGKCVLCKKNMTKKRFSTKECNQLHKNSLSDWYKWTHVKQRLIKPNLHGESSPTMWFCMFPSSKDKIRRLGSVIALSLVSHYIFDGFLTFWQSNQTINVHANDQIQRHVIEFKGISFICFAG